jgi:hypothetical protein
VNTSFSKIRLFAVVFIIAIACEGRAQDEGIHSGQTVASPNGIFTVEYTDSGGLIPGVDGFIVKNNKTGNTYPPIDVAILYPVKWTGDSQTIVSVKAIAGGDTVDVFRLEGNEWKGYSADLGKGNSYTVIRELVEYNVIELTYIIREIGPNNSSADFYTYSFTFHPDTAQHTNEQMKQLDEGKRPARHILTTGSGSIGW